MMAPLDIWSKAPTPVGLLSNFAPHRFEFDGVECASMEALLQAFKFADPDEQAEICSLVGSRPRAVAVARRGTTLRRCVGWGGPTRAAVGRTRTCWTGPTRHSRATAASRPR